MIDAIAFIVGVELMVLLALACMLCCVLIADITKRGI